MRLPNGECAIVGDRKLVEYVLNRRHPVGRHHAALFDRLRGIGLDNFKVQQDALLEAAVTAEVSRGLKTPFGQKYEMRFEVNGPVGPKSVLAVWIVEHGQDRPRLITCYVE